MNNNIWDFKDEAAADPLHSGKTLAGHFFPVSGPKRPQPEHGSTHLQRLIDQARKSADKVKIASSDKLPWEEQPDGKLYSTPTEVMRYKQKWLRKQLGFVRTVDPKGNEDITCKTFGSKWLVGQSGEFLALGYAQELAKLDIQLAVIDKEIAFKNQLSKWIRGEAPPKTYQHCRWMLMANQTAMELKAASSLGQYTKVAALQAKLADERLYLVNEHPEIRSGFLQDRETVRIKTSEFLSWLARTVPKTQEEAYLWYKYLVKRKPIDTEWIDAPSWMIANYKKTKLTTFIPPVPPVVPPPPPLPANVNGPAPQAAAPVSPLPATQNTSATTPQTTPAKKPQLTAYTPSKPTPVKMKTEVDPDDKTNAPPSLYDSFFEDVLNLSVKKEPSSPAPEPPASPAPEPPASPVKLDGTGETDDPPPENKQASDSQEPIEPEDTPSEPAEEAGNNKENTGAQAAEDEENEQAEIVQDLQTTQEIESDFLKALAIHEQNKKKELTAAERNARKKAAQKAAEKKLVESVLNDEKEFSEPSGKEEYVSQSQEEKESEQMSVARHRNLNMLLRKLDKLPQRHVVQASQLGMTDRQVAGEAKSLAEKLNKEINNYKFLLPYADDVQNPSKQEQKIRSETGEKLREHIMKNILELGHRYTNDKKLIRKFWFSVNNLLIEKDDNKNPARNLRYV